MTHMRRFARFTCLVALASVSALICSAALAAQPAAMPDNSPALQPSPSTDGELSTVGPIKTPGSSEAFDGLLTPSESVPSYTCTPATGHVYRCCTVGPEGQYWFRTDYLLWWTQGATVVPLVTTSDQADGGLIGEPSTEILFGGERLNGQARSNFRIRFGAWLHCGRTCGVEFDYFNLGEAGTSFWYGSDATGNPLYARPFFDANPLTAGRNAQLVSDPGWLRGTVEGRIDEYFQSAGVNMIFNLWCNEPCCTPSCEEDCCEDDCSGDECVDSCGYAGACSRLGMYREGVGSLLERLRSTRHRVDFIVGYRHYQLTDSLRIHEDLEAYAGHGQITAGTTFDVVDEFRSRNDFHGAELGLVTQFWRGCWSLELLAKMSLGNNSRTVTINGSTTNQAPGDVPVTYDAGLLALETNVGRYTSDKFVVIPQFGAELGYQVNCHLRAFVGYNLILWNDVARAPQQIDFVVNSEYIPPAQTPTGPARPSFDWRNSDFWAQGINLGAEYRF